jgi:serine/threonine-protein kinase
MDKYQAFIGKILDGRYKILELVGMGGMAFVLKAEDLVMNRTVAIKILNERYNGDEQAEKRFVNESKAVAMLSNKNIVNVYDVAIYPDIKYIVMEYLDGITLREYMDNKKVLPWKEACVYTLQIIHALEHAHGKNVIHRDIKPQNIILLKSGEVKVTDFGIAKIPDMADITLTDKAIGTVYYISPEQASGKETTYASDLYSVGVMLYEMVTGELPFTADSPVTIAMMQINDIPKNPCEINPEIPTGVSQIILKAMSKQPEKRFKDAHSMLKALDYVLKHPEVVFVDENEEERPNTEEEAEVRELSSDRVNINMIATDSIGDYVVNVGEPAKEEKPKVDKKQLKAERKKRRKQRRKERPSHSIFPVITGVFIAFMIVVFAVAGYLAVKWIPTLFAGEKPNDFFVRDLTDLQYSTDLRRELEDQGYIIELIEVYRQGVGFNVIVDQEPATGNIRTSDGKCRIKISVNKYPDNLTVPDVKYMTVTEAEKILKQYNLYAITEYVTDEFANEKQIVGTKPEIGAYILPGSQVTLYVCKGTDITSAKTMPNVVGDKIDTAKDKLEKSYYLVTVVYENRDKPDGTVLSQDIPAYTTGLAPWTMVTLTVSRYTPYKTVENYFGLTLEAASSKIKNTGFVLGRVTHAKSEYPDGTVINQSVKAGTPSPAGTVINLVISGEGTDLASPVPDVLGKDATTAAQMLENAGYSVTIVGQPSDKPADTVLKQSLTAGNSGYPIGTNVTITVAVSADSVQIKDLKGRTFPEVLKYLSDNKLNLGAVQFSTDAPEGTVEYTVLTQTVAVGTYVAPGTMIGITLYGSSRSAYEVPSTIGMTEAGAIKALNDAWYRVEVVYEYANSTDGVVLRQSIEAGTLNKAPGTKITITVCIRKTTVTVPDLSGKQLDGVVDILLELGLELGDVSYEKSSAPSGSVISQTPTSGTEVAYNTPIDIVLSE